MNPQVERRIAVISDLLERAKRKRKIPEYVPFTEYLLNLCKKQRQALERVEIETYRTSILGHESVFKVREALLFDPYEEM